jgi:uncharacterized coiled-coil DUF342 family protein
MVEAKRLRQDLHQMDQIMREMKRRADMLRNRSTALEQKVEGAAKRLRGLTRASGSGSR